jgi:hypothetical protein
MLRALRCIALFGALVAALGAQTDLSTLGPHVGQRALGFNLPDQMGRAQTLKTVAGPKGTMLVFFRSADW